LNSATFVSGKALAAGEWRVKLAALSPMALTLYFTNGSEIKI